MLLHNALAMAGVHMAHLDTGRSVAANAVWATHKQLTSLLALKETLACGGVELRWDVVGNL